MDDSFHSATDDHVPRSPSPSFLTSLTSSKFSRSPPVEPFPTMAAPPTVNGHSQPQVGLSPTTAGSPEMANTHRDPTAHDRLSTISDNDSITTLSKRQRVKSIVHKITSAPKHILIKADIIHPHEDPVASDTKVIPGITDNAAFNTGMLDEPEEPPAHGPVGTAIRNPVDTMKEAGRIIAHPRNHAKRAAAGQVTASENPFLSEGMDEQLVEAHQALEDLEAGKQREVHAIDTSDDDLDIVNAKHNIEFLNTERETRKSAWITSKHVRRVRAVRLPMVAEMPDMDDFYVRDRYGLKGRWVWEMYFGRLMLYLTQSFVVQHAEDTNDIFFSRDELLRQTERLLVASSPFQHFFMHVYKVYRWEDPKLTAQWFAVWMFMIKTGYIGTTLWFYVVYVVLHNKYTKDHLGHMRDSQERVDSGGRPYKLGELVSRHGDEDWIDPIMDEFGPVVQQLVSDLADVVEILVNFYNWRRAEATRNSVILWAALGIVSALISTEYGLKIALFGMGMMFFVAQPIASKYPRWRKVVSMTRWVHWDVPNNAELAFQGLQEDAQKAQKRMTSNTMIAADQGTGGVHAGPLPRVPITNGSSHQRDQFNSDIQHTTIDSPRRTGYIDPATTIQPTDPFIDRNATTHTDDILAFRGTYHGQPGRVIITPTTLRFVPSAPRTTSSRHPSAPVPQLDALFTHPHSHLLELRKTSSLASSVLNPLKHALPPTSTKSSTEALTLIWINGTSDTIEAMRKRDDAFNSIIGFSGLRWSVQQPLEGVRAPTETSGATEGSGPGGRRTDVESRDKKHGRGKHGEEEEEEALYDGRGVLDANGQIMPGEGDGRGGAHNERSTVQKIADKARSVLHPDGDSERREKKHESKVLQQAAS